MEFVAPEGGVQSKSNLTKPNHLLAKGFSYFSAILIYFPSTQATNQSKLGLQLRLEAVRTSQDKSSINALK